MSKNNGSKVSAFCLAKIRPQAVRVKSPVVALPKPTTTPGQQVEFDQKLDRSATGGVAEVSRNGSQKKVASFLGRKIMIVVDSSLEAKGALQWAFTHTVQNTDLVTLLHVVTSSKPSYIQGRELSEEEIPQKVDQLLKSMKKLCQSTKPEVEVEVQVVAGKDKGEAIVEEAKRKGTGMLILGQKKRSTTTRLLMMWTGGRGGGLTVPEYCIQNAPCVAIAVRRKSKKHGGYLITTKRHKDFWLLA
ncbi:hypothetical protein QQ045_014533 [Rhodiola kirilowii]